MHFLYIQKNKKIFLSRDFAGKKPLYLFEHKDFIIWSSTLFPLNSVYLKKYLSINKDAVYNYFQVGCVPSPLSIFNNVKK